jgi:hypothetical protein
LHTNVTTITNETKGQVCGLYADLTSVRACVVFSVDIFADTNSIGLRCIDRPTDRQLNGLIDL